MNPVVSRIQFKFAPKKALAAIHWMVTQKSGIDLHALMKACYFADKDQLNSENQPVFGATYRAMRFGPVPLEIYEMAKGEAIWLADLRQDSYPWELQGYRLRLTGNSQPNMSVFSESDLSKLESGFDLSSRLSFDSRTLKTHGVDWQRANLGIMKYEDMLDETPDKQERVEYLRESARFMKL